MNPPLGGKREINSRENSQKGTPSSHCFLSPAIFRTSSQYREEKASKLLWTQAKMDAITPFNALPQSIHWI
jgi:hypothetical protein